MGKQATAVNIHIQEADFDQNQLYQGLRGSNETGAIVTFTGLVREFDGQGSSMRLEHYPNMTEQILRRIANNACEQWPLNAATVIHRVGSLAPNEQIVFVGVASAHRDAAFKACHFIIDLLKTRAPFWKKEGSHWVEAKSSDQDAAKCWLEDHA